MNDDLSRRLEDEMRRQAEMERGTNRNLPVHQPSNVPVEVTPTYPVRPYHPTEVQYPVPYPYPPRRQGPGWGGVFLIVLVITAPMGWVGYQLIMQQQQMIFSLQRQGSESAASAQKSAEQALAVSKDALDTVKTQTQEAADARVAREKADADRRIADLNARNAANSLETAKARKGALVQRLEASVPILEQRLSSLGFAGNCLFNSECEKKQASLRDAIASAKLTLTSAKNLTEGAIISNPENIETLEKSTDKLYETLNKS